MGQMTKFFYSLFNGKDKQFFVGVLMLTILTAVIELMGIGALFPYIKILGQPELIHQNAKLAALYHFFHFKREDYFLIFSGVGIFILILTKACMSNANNYYQSKFSCRLNNRLAKFCLNSFLRMSYSEFINTNSAVLSKHLLVDVNSVISILTSILTLMTDCVVAAALIGLMIWADPVLVLGVVAILGGFLWLSMATTKTRIRNLARDNERCNREAYRTAGESLSGLKEIKIYGVENYFIKRFLNWQEKLSRQTVEYNVISNIPGIAMNVMGFGVLLVILLYLIITKGNLVNILPTMGLIAVCVQRLLPSAARISSAITLVRRYKPSVFIVRDALTLLSSKNKAMDSIKAECQALSFREILSLKNVSYQYPGSEQYSLKNISLAIKKNTSIGIVGQSGAGKSTLVDVLLGLLPIQAGQICCDEVDISRYEHVALSNLIGYVPQQTFLIDGSIKENITFGIPENEINWAQLDRAIKVAQLEKFIHELPKGLETPIGENGVKLSGGQRQRLGIARALYHDPEILIMDEATNALDSATENEFNESLLGLMREKTIIIIAHRLSSIQICDEIVQIEKGEIVERGSYDQLVRSSERFRHIYNIEAPIYE